MADKAPAFDVVDSDEVDLWSNENDKEAKHVDVDLNEGDSQTHKFSNFPDSAVDVEDDIADETDSAGLLGGHNKHAIWSFAYYQALFNVDSTVVLNRIVNSLIPKKSAAGNFSRNNIKGKPDLYGPFWICTTLIVTILICGNLTTLLNHMSDTTYHYTPQFERLSIAAVIVYGYTSLIPLCLKAFLWIRKVPSSYSYMDIMCTYGYSMFVFIPLSILLLIPNGVVDWILVCCAAALSGIVVTLNLIPALEDTNKLPLAVLFALHFGFALIFRLYFFSTVALTSEPSNSTVNNLPNVVQVTTIINNSKT